MCKATNRWLERGWSKAACQEGIFAFRPELPLLYCRLKRQSFHVISALYVHFPYIRFFLISKWYIFKEWMDIWWKVSLPLKGCLAATHFQFIENLSDILCAFWENYMHLQIPHFQKCISYYTVKFVNVFWIMFHAWTLLTPIYRKNSHFS